MHYGPRKAALATPLSASRAAVLERLRDQPEPVSLAALAKVTGLHTNTLREHLDGLLRAGMVRRFQATPHGRGRPAWLYEATVEQTGGEYAGLAAALAATIARSSPDPARDAALAGEEWGRSLAHDRGARPTDAQAARDNVVTLLADVGYAPEADREDPSLFRLTRCPLLEAAHRHRDVVCAVHLGIVRGALAEYGVDGSDSEITPFAEPGACRLTVPLGTPTDKMDR